MTTPEKKRKNFILAIVGSVLLVLGVTLILAWWPDLVTVFRGAAGMVLALAGLLVLYTMKL